MKKSWIIFLLLYDSIAYFVSLNNLKREIDCGNCIILQPIETRVNIETFYPKQMD